MAKRRKQKLKVFRTPIGFHDAYVAAPSQKAALEAWGAESDLFAQGIAERVEEPKLMEEPLSRPGEVIRKLRGSEEEHVAVLGKALPKDGEARSKAAKTKKDRKPPKPSRADLDAAEEALEKAEMRQRKAVRGIEQKIAELQRDLRALLRKHETRRDELAQRRDRARTAYERAIEAWRK